MNKPMLSTTLVLAILLSPLSVLASLDAPAPHGFHWYSIEETHKTPKPIKPQAPMQSPYEKLMALRLQTKNKLARALLEPSVETTYDYMKAQQFYAKKNQAFVRFWQQTLLLHPELDHRLNFPTDNSAIAVRNDMTSKMTEDVIKVGAKVYGLILFYEGRSPISQKFANHFMAFVDASHFETISVATDGALIQGLPNQRKIPLKPIQQKLNLVPHYMPALFLVNLKTQKMTPLSYGTGLSILECDPNANVQATLSKSNFKNVDLRNLSSKVVLCLDNDGDKTFKDELITKSVIRLLDAGKKVSIVMPDKTGADFNDVLREEGAQSVAKQLANPVDAKTLLKSEIQAVKAKDKNFSTLEGAKQLRKLNQDTSLGAEVNEKQIAQLKALDASAKKQMNRISENYKHDILVHNQTLVRSTITRAQKELER